MLRTVTAKPLVRNKSTQLVQQPHVGSLYTVAVRCALARAAVSSISGSIDMSDRLVMASLSSKSKSQIANSKSQQQFRSDWGLGWGMCQLPIIDGRSILMR